MYLRNHESDWAAADRERLSYYSMSSQCSQLPGIAPGQLSLKSCLICFKYDLFFCTYCWQSPLSPRMPRHHPVHNKILYWCVGIYLSKQTWHQNPTTEFKASLSAFMPRCLKPAFPLASVTMMAKELTSQRMFRDCFVPMNLPTSCCKFLMLPFSSDHFWTQCPETQRLYPAQLGGLKLCSGPMGALFCSWT